MPRSTCFCGRFGSSAVVSCSIVSITSPYRDSINPGKQNSNHKELIPLALIPRARMREAGLSNGFCPSVSVSVSQSVCHQTFGLITTTKGLNTSKRHSNNDNSGEKQCMVYLKVAEAVLFTRISSYLSP